MTSVLSYIFSNEFLPFDEEKSREAIRRMKARYARFRDREHVDPSCAAVATEILSYMPDAAFEADKEGATSGRYFRGLCTLSETEIATKWLDCMDRLASRARAEELKARTVQIRARKLALALCIVSLVALQLLCILAFAQFRNVDGCALPTPLPVPRAATAAAPSNIVDVGDRQSVANVINQTEEVLRGFSTHGVRLTTALAIAPPSFDRSTPFESPAVELGSTPWTEAVTTIGLAAFQIVAHALSQWRASRV